MSAPAVHGPADLPDLRLWLRDQWKPGAVFDGVVGRHARRHDTLDVDWYSRWEHQTLGRADLWYVAADMVDLLAAAMPGVPDDVAFPDLPRAGHAGLVILEKPLSGIDAETGERTIQLDGFTWGGASLPPIARPGSVEGIPCVSISSYRRLDFDDGLNQRDVLALATLLRPYTVTKREQWQVVDAWCRSRLIAAPGAGYSEADMLLVEAATTMNRRGKPR